MRLLETSTGYWEVEPSQVRMIKVVVPAGEDPEYLNVRIRRYRAILEHPLSGLEFLGAELRLDLEESLLINTLYWSRIGSSHFVSTN